MTTSNARLTAADKTLIVLQAAIEHERFSDIVTATGFAKATVHRILQTLLDYEFVYLASDGTYAPGVTSLRLASRAFNSIDISEVANPVLTQLAEETGYTVHVGALNVNEAIYVAKRQGPTPYEIPSTIGKRLPLHSTTIGKCLLADMDTSQLASVVKQAGLAPLTPNTITTPEDLDQEIAVVRTRGYSFDDEENVPGIRCIGAPIFDHSGKATYGISLTSLAMENTLKQIERFAPLVTEAAAEISHNLGAHTTKYSS
ncbi:MAG: IclR family transcriptional regulator [Corynebacterium propinquum]|uniref:IclR family transcriptional regulator n=1 Tax=Corynebacterium propinquum TaxID=43769 RepID=UPI000DB06FAC|nr:IclR family transcriptional regulator [Corynebacterium propinquum]MDK4319178.1 IclR family transcriptional regulator [Corynebacterium propinquum]PZQ26823.1 MAG: IclR family transcriptional regulator [Corynebacterium propinquum]